MPKELIRTTSRDRTCYWSRFSISVSTKKISQRMVSSWELLRKNNKLRKVGGIYSAKPPLQNQRLFLEFSHYSKYNLWKHISTINLDLLKWIRAVIVKKMHKKL